MIVSFDHRFIFVKTRKVAGSSIELFLRQFCGPNDIVTPLVREDEWAASQGIRPPSVIPSRLVRPWEKRSWHWRRILRRHEWPRKPEFRTHHSASELRAQLGGAVWNGSFKFTVMRNPWDRVVSEYFWLQTRRSIPLDWVVGQAGRNWQTITIDGRVAVDVVLRYERLIEDLGDVCDRLGLARPIDLPRAKSTQRPPNIRALDFLSDAQIKRIAVICRPEIELFGYTPDD